MNAALISALLGHWWRNPVQLVTLLAGLALGTALWSGVQAINAEARASYEAAAATLGEGRLGQIRAADGGPLSQATYVALRRAGWDVSPVIEGERRFGSERLRILGIDPLTLPPQAAQADTPQTRFADMKHDGGLSSYNFDWQVAFTGKQASGRTSSNVERIEYG